MIRLFLDDERMPIDCAKYMYTRLSNVTVYHEKWEIVRNYDEFVDYIKTEGLPDIISFDHDLGFYKNPTDYDKKEKTGYDCAKWLVDYCIDNKKKLPEFLVHSMNPIGYQNIKKYLENYKENEND